MKASNPQMIPAEVRRSMNPFSKTSLEAAPPQYKTDKVDELATARRFSFYLFEDFALHAFSSAIEVLRLANDVAGSKMYEWRVVSLNGEPVVSSCGTRLAADTSLPDERESLGRPWAPGMVILCGGDRTPGACRPLEAWVRECRRHKVAVAGLAGGTYALARSGLLDGRRCAVHWEHYPHFSEEFSNVEASQTAFEIDGEVHTCAGGNASFDMFMRIIGDECGQGVANRICEVALSERVREAGERQRLPLQARVGIDHAALIKIIAQMEANVAEPLTLAELARATGLSRRQIERLFVREMGRAPARYYLEMRLERAHLLLIGSSRPIVDIAVACGFVSASHFSKTYRVNYGCPPQQMRLAMTEKRSSGHVRNGQRVLAPLPR